MIVIIAVVVVVVGCWCCCCCCCGCCCYYCSCSCSCRRRRRRGRRCCCLLFVVCCCCCCCCFCLLRLYLFFVCVIVTVIDSFFIVLTIKIIRICCFDYDYSTLLYIHHYTPHTLGLATPKKTPSWPVRSREVLGRGRRSFGEAGGLSQFDLQLRGQLVFLRHLMARAQAAWLF